MLGNILAPTHLLVIVIVAALVFGPRRLPEVGRGLGQGLREFRASLGARESDEP